jgi:hypothetical protein
VNQTYDKIVDEAEERDVLNDIETPENKLLSETLEQLEEKDYLERFMEETDYDNFQNKCDDYSKSDIEQKK